MEQVCVTDVATYCCSKLWVQGRPIAWYSFGAASWLGLLWSCSTDDACGNWFLELPIWIWEQIDHKSFFDICINQFHFVAAERVAETSNVVDVDFKVITNVFENFFHYFPGNAGRVTDTHARKAIVLVRELKRGGDSTKVFLLALLMSRYISSWGNGKGICQRRHDISPRQRIVVSVGLHWDANSWQQFLEIGKFGCSSLLT